MKDVSTEFQDALSQAQELGLVPRRLLWVYAKERSSGNTVELGIWNDIDDITIEVKSGVSGIVVTRPYYGNVSLSVPEIVRVSDLTSQTVPVEMSQISDVTQNIVRTYDLRLARCEIHDLLLDPSTRAQVAPAEIAFLGIIDEVTVDTPEAGSSGNITLSIISDAIAMLSRVNPFKSSYEGQKRRGDDQWGLYSNTIAKWTIPWGTNS